MVTICSDAIAANVKPQIVYGNEIMYLSNLRTAVGLNKSKAGLI